MKRWISRVLCLLTVLAMAPAQAGTVHVSREISSDMRINADIAPLEKAEYGLYKVIYPDLNRHETLNESAMAERLFHDQAAEQTVKIERDEQYREGGGTVSNSAGEMVHSTQTGMLFYRDEPVFERFGAFQLEVIKTVALDIMSRAPFPLADQATEFAFMASTQAEQTALSILKPFNMGFEVRLAHCIRADAATLTRAAAFFQLDQEYSQADECYLVHYEWLLEGVPVLNRYSKDSYKMISGDQSSSNEGPYAFFGINAGGLFFADIQAVQGVEYERRQVLTHDEALEQLTKYLEELIPETPTEIRGGYLRYAVMSSPEGYYEGTLEPVWLFPSVAQGEDGEWNPGKTFALHGVSGQMLL